MERIVRTLLSHPSMLTAVALENRRAGPTHRNDRKCKEVKEVNSGITWKILKKKKKKKTEGCHEDVWKDMEGSPLSK